MPLHLIKLCVGVDSIGDLRDWQKARLAAMRKAGERPELSHRTFQAPKRRQEIMDGGSLYWVIKGVVQVRQLIRDLRDGTKDDGTPCCLIVLDKTLVPVRPVPRRAFQGWRYLDPADAPPDLKGLGADALASLPAKMRRELAELGLL